MGKEIERKFLLQNDGWRDLAKGVPYRQAYLCASGKATARVRVVGEDKAYLAVKGRTCGAARTEFEYEIPRADADEMLESLACGGLVEKMRHKIPVDGIVWEIDEFLGDNAGLVIAEIELESEDQTFARPDWLGREVTGDARYYNSNLAQNPYKNWK